jgi:AcrR family transcriptional regulator
LPPSEGVNPEREQRIFDAAAELFAHYGYAKTTVDEIAAHAGISKGAVYLHFRGKDDLMDRLIVREAERLMDVIMARLDSEPQGITLFNLYRHSMLAINDSPLLRALYVRDRRVLGDYLRRVQKTPMFQQSAMFGTDFITHFQRAGMIKPDVNPETLAYILMAVRYGMLNIDEYAPETASPPLEEMGQVIGDMLQQAFGTETGNSEEGRKALRTLFEQGQELLKQMRTIENDTTAR